MTKEEILDYVTETPGNTNRNVLGSMLNQFAKSEGGGGGAEPVYLYVLDHAIESDDTLPPIPEEFSGYHWEISDNHYAVSLSENGTALKFGELVSIIKQGSPIYVVDVAPEGGYGSMIQNIYELFMAENIYRWNDEEDYHVSALFSSGNYSSVGVFAHLQRN